MSSIVEICNMALGSVGVAHEINNLDEETTEAEQCSRWYEQTRDATIRDMCPTFARKYATLGLVTENPNNDWRYAYRYPNDCLRALRLVSSRNFTVRTPWELGHDASGKLIYTDEPNAVLRYIRKIEDTELFDSAFVEALSWRLGSKLAIPLSRSKDERDYAYKRYQIERAQSQANDANESGTDAPRDAESIAVRD